MFVSQMLAPVVSLGPGERIAIWTSGCSKHCAGCISPELRMQLPEQDVAVDEIAQMLLGAAREHGVHRLTVSGGARKAAGDNPLCLRRHSRLHRIHV